MGKICGAGYLTAVNRDEQRLHSTEIVTAVVEVLLNI